MDLKLFFLMFGFCYTIFIIAMIIALYTPDRARDWIMGERK